jgi:hypothetical protein
MKKVLNIGIIVAALAVIFFESVIIRKQSVQIQTARNDIARTEHHFTVLKNNITDSWKHELSTLNTDSIFDEDGQKLNADYFNKPYPVLLFRFSKIDCSDCVVKQIDLIKEFIRNNEIKYMMVSNYANKRNLGLFKRVNEIKDQVYDCKKIFDNENRTPFFCIYYQGTVSNVFFPDEDFPELTKLYLITVMENIFRNY